MKTVLISGASVAGPALAYWLRRHGFAPSADGLRSNVRTLVFGAERRFIHHLGTPGAGHREPRRARA